MKQLEEQGNLSSNNSTFMCTSHCHSNIPYSKIPLILHLIIWHLNISSPRPFVSLFTRKTSITATGRSQIHVQKGLQQCLYINHYITKIICHLPGTVNVRLREFFCTHIFQPTIFHQIQKFIFK